MRNAELHRVTKETDVYLKLTVPDGPNQSVEQQLDTGVPFFDHMLKAMSFHGRLGLEVKGTGDLDVDPHHMVEDVGLVLGHCLLEVAQQAPMERYGHSVIPMDEALSEATVDLCNRPFLVYEAQFPQTHAGTFDLSLGREFFQALANNGRMNLHLHCRYGHNGHHMIEALFKATGRALSAALTPKGQLMSTKGSL